MKKAAVLIALLFGLVVAGVAFADNGPETIVLKAKKGNVTFHHHKHQSRMECGECHHGPGHSAYTEGMQIHECDECHKAGFPNKKLAKPMKAFHKNCKGCHKEKKAGPTKCSGCHKK